MRNYLPSKSRAKLFRRSDSGKIAVLRITTHSWKRIYAIEKLPTARAAMEAERLTLFCAKHYLRALRG
jgi:hypothetical protein